MKHVPFHSAVECFHQLIASSGFVIPSLEGCGWQWCGSTSIDVDFVSKSHSSLSDHVQMFRHNFTDSLSHTPSHIVTTTHHQRPSLINFSIISSVPPPRDPFSRNIQKFSFSLILLPTWLSHTFLKSHTLVSSLSLSFLCHSCIHTSIFLPTILPTSQSIKSSVCLPSIPSHKFPPSVPAENYKLLLATSIPPLRKIGNTCPFTNIQLA